MGVSPVSPPNSAIPDGEFSLKKCGFWISCVRVFPGNSDKQFIRFRTPFSRKLSFNLVNRFGDLRSFLLNTLLLHTVSMGFFTVSQNGCEALSLGGYYPRGA